LATISRPGDKIKDETNFYICSRYQPGGGVPAHKELLAEEARQLEIFRSAIDPSEVSKATCDMIKCKVVINTNIFDI
jgi:hypothetical protein